MKQSDLSKNSFEGKTIVAGLDVHKKNWFVTIRTGEIELATKVFEPDVCKLVSYLRRTYTGAKFIIGYEAGYTGFWIYEQMRVFGIECRVFNAADIPTNDKESKLKTDRSDSRKIARELINNHINSIYVPDRQMQELRSFIRQRFTIVKEMTRIKNRIKSFLSFYGIPLRTDFVLVQTHWSKNFINWLEQIQMNTETGKETLMSMIRQLTFLRNELLLITKKLRTIMICKEYKEIYNRLKSIPGIGVNTAMMLISEICDIKRFKSVDKLACFIGIIPNEYSSGNSKRIGGLTSRGKSQLKQVLIEASWMAIRKDPYLTNFFNESAKRMVKQKAIIKIARKLVSRIHHVWKTGEVYKFNYNEI